VDRRAKRGTPRSGKSSIAEVIQETFEGPWMNLGVDAFSRHVTPPRYRPGMGLRPGGERQDIEALIPRLYAAFYDSVAAHSRHGLNVVVDAGHHDAYSKPLRILPDAARRLRGLPALLIGIRCSLEKIIGPRLRHSGDSPNGTEPRRHQGVESDSGRRLAGERRVQRPGLYPHGASGRPQT
jgi:chloramphenicol 3-O phosphotransferase